MRNNRNIFLLKYEICTFSSYIQYTKFLAPTGALGVKILSVCVRPCVRACMRACVRDIMLKSVKKGQKESKQASKQAG